MVELDLKGFFQPMILAFQDQGTLVKSIWSAWSNARTAFCL